jgi:hypothetical protein
MTDSGRNGTTDPHLVCIVGHIGKATLEKPPALQLAQEKLLGVEANQGLQNVEGKGTSDLNPQRPSLELGNSCLRPHERLEQGNYKYFPWAGTPHRERKNSFVEVGISTRTVLSTCESLSQVPCMPSFQVAFCQICLEHCPGL